MTEREENNNSTIAKNPVKTSPLEKIETQRLRHEVEKKEWQEQINEVLNKNIDLGDRLSESEERINKLEITNKALDKELWRERRQTNVEQIEKQTEAQKVGKMALDIIKKRVRERYGVNCSCDDCKPINRL